MKRKMRNDESGEFILGIKEIEGFLQSLAARLGISRAIESWL